MITRIKGLLTFDFFCNEQGGLTYIGDDKKIGLTSYDYGHLSPIASEYLANELLIPIVLKNENQALH